MADEIELAASLPDDEAAFEAGFAGESVEVAEPVEEVVEPAEVVEEPSESAEPVAEVVEPAETAEEPAEAAEPPKLIAGLTEEQIVNALARASSLQSAVDKMAGRMGNLMQRIDALAAAPKTAAEQRAFDLKFEKLTEAFPELADILRHDLQHVGAPAVQAEQVPTGYTQEQVDQLVNSRLETFQQQQMQAMEVRALGAVHPDWQDVIRTPQFAVWRDNVIPDGQALMESESAAFISQRLSEFKQWQYQAQQRAVQPAQQPPKVDRLRNAITPTGRVAPAVGPVSEDDAFEAGFKNSYRNA